jgi:hypothetical protein
LRPQPGHEGIAFDESGQQFLQSDGQPYAAKFDTGNQVWRVVSTSEPGKPGMPVARNADGTWRVSGDSVGGPGGMLPGDAARQRAVADAERNRQELRTRYESVDAEHDRGARAIDDALAASRGYKADADVAQQELNRAERMQQDALRAKDVVQQRLRDPAQATDDAKHELEQIERQLADANRDIQNAKSRMDHATRRSDEAWEQSRRLGSDLSSVQQRLEQVHRDWTRAEEDVRRLQQQ